jgi:hypothetical protein
MPSDMLEMRLGESWLRSGKSWLHLGESELRLLLRLASGESELRLPPRLASGESELRHPSRLALGEPWLHWAVGLRPVVALGESWPQASHGLGWVIGLKHVVARNDQLDRRWKHISDCLVSGAPADRRKLRSSSQGKGQRLWALLGL